eukprot:238061_1
MMSDPTPTTPEINTKDSNWSWFVWPNSSQTNQMQATNDKASSGESTVVSSRGLENEFQLVQQELNTHTTTVSYEHSLLEHPTIHDQYVDLNTNHDANSNTTDAEDEMKHNHNKDESKDEAQDAVIISQTLTLQSRNQELERERDELHSETLQLRMQTECLRQTNDHIIAAQQQEIEKLHNDNRELNSSLSGKEAQLKEAQKQIAMLKRERDNLKKKLHDVCYDRLNIIDKENNESVDMTKSEVLVSDKHIVYGCIHCGQHLFDSRALIQRQIEIDDNTFGLIVDGLFNNNDATMGPTVCKTFLNGMYKVKE